MTATHQYRLLTAMFLATLLAACGGGDGSPWQNGGGGGSTNPSAPGGLSANAGDGAVSLGWSAPSSGTAPFSYTITVTPQGTYSISQNGTTALVRGLTNGTAYTFEVSARNNSGSGDSASIRTMPTAAGGGSAYTALALGGSSGGNEASGIFAPALLRSSGGDTWLAYNGVNRYSSAGVNFEDQSVNLARSSDGQAFTYNATLGVARNATVTDTGGAGNCSAVSCSGRWVYAAPWLIDDSGDPDSNRRYKLFAHRYFVAPATQPQAFPALGAIVMWTAPAPTGAWSAETALLGWNFTPPELTPHRNVNSVHTDLADCLNLSEGSATVRNGNIEFVFSCTLDNTSPATQKVVMLRSADHANSFDYVATLLQPADAAAYSADYFSAAAVLPSAGNAPVLLVTPVSAGIMAGCVILPFADIQSGTLFRSGNNPLSILRLPLRAGRSGGSCGWDRGATGTGILISEFDTNAAQPFSILATGRSL